MPASRQNHSASRKTGKGESGQAVMEFALGILPIVLFLLFGMIDFSRAIYQQQVITGLTRSGSSMAARGTSYPDVAGVAGVFTILTQGTLPLNLGTYGKIIGTAVTNTGTAGTPSYQVTAQNYTGSCTGCSSTTSVVAPGGVGSTPQLPAMPPSGAAFPQPGQTTYVTEIFYAYQPLTPIGRLIVGLLLPAQSYDVAYI